MTTLTRYSPTAVDRGLHSSADDLGALLLKSGLVPFLLVDAGNIVAASPALRDMLGGTSPYHHVDGRRLSSIISETDQGAVEDFCRGLLRSGARAEVRCSLVHAGGQTVPVQLSGTALAADATQQIVLLVTDLSAWLGADAAAGAAQMAGAFDAVTGFATRGLLLDRMKIALANARRHRRRVAVLRIDMARFETLLQSLAPAAAAEVEATVAETLRNCVRESDTLARLGRQEFVLVLSEIAERDDAGVSAARVVAAIGALFGRNAPERRISAHIGVSVYPTDGTSAERLLESADTALRLARGLGEGSFALADATGAELTALETIEYLPHHDTGVEEVDTEHRALVVRTNALVQAYKDGADATALESEMRAIAQGLRTHFAFEARLLGTSPYEGSIDLKTSNLRFLDELECILLHVNGQSILLAIRHLHDWLAGHLVTADGHRAS